jgi:hypothetical protein
MAMRIPLAILLVALAIHLSAHIHASALQHAATQNRRAEASASASQASVQDQTPTFAASVDVVRTDAIVRDARGQFIADLKVGEFEVFEDGVKQEIVSLTMIHGGREFNVLSPPMSRLVRNVPVLNSLEMSPG